MSKPNTQEWIPYKTNPPTEDGKYLVILRRIATADLGANDNIVRILKFKDGQFVMPRHMPSDAAMHIHEDVIGWLPIPPILILNKCQDCTYQEYDPAFGLICPHRASMEGIEAAKSFYTPDEVTECQFYINEDSDKCREPFTGCKLHGTWAENYEREYIAFRNACRDNNEETFHQSNEPNK